MDQRVGSSSKDVLPTPISGGRSLTTEQRESLDLSSTIPGWGSDLDPARRPGVPRDKAPELGVESLYPPFAQQVPHVKIHKSTEHGKLTPVFGTACPPRGISGKLRDLAYRLSEGRLLHWMALIAADRVNVVEDVLSDMAHLRVPNLVRETGLRSELKYNRAGLAKKAAVVGLGVAAYIAWSRSRRRQ